jgi:hypothetical protein
MSKTFVSKSDFKCEANILKNNICLLGKDFAALFKI